MNERDELIAGLRKLKLPGVALNLEMRLKEANKNYVGYLNFLSLILQYEMISKESNNLKKRIRSAGFTRETTFEDFVFSFNKEAVPVKMIKDLASGHLWRELII